MTLTQSCRLNDEEAFSANLRFGREVAVQLAGDVYIMVHVRGAENYEDATTRARKALSDVLYGAAIAVLTEFTNALGEGGRDD